MSLPDYCYGGAVLGTVEFLGETVEVRSPTIADTLVIGEVWDDRRNARPVNRTWRWRVRRLLIRLRLVRARKAERLADDFEVMAWMFPLLLVGWEDMKPRDVQRLPLREAVKLMLDVFLLVGSPEGKKPEAPGKS